MKLFSCDYQEGACPEILQELGKCNFEQNPGYGEDRHCREAARLLREACGADNAAVHFLVGGTQVNFVLLAAALKPYQGVFAADTGHISVHETGAVEATGHKVLPLASKDGKITASQVDEACRAHYEDEAHEHMVMPGAVYLSQPTEYGTIYAPEELRAFRAVCDRWGLVLYADGARLGYAMAADAEVTLPLLAETTDAFTVGGTKQGALFGEALVILEPALNRDFRYLMKQRGAMLAKGWLIGLQFEVLLRDGLYLALSRAAIRTAGVIHRAAETRGIPFYIDSPTNQQFLLLTPEQVSRLREKYGFSVFGRSGKYMIARLCTGWATRDEDAEELARDILSL